MQTAINMSLPGRAPGCFLRDVEKKDVVDTFFAHKGLFVHCGKSEANRQVRDWAAERLMQRHQIDAQTAAAYEEQVCALFHAPELRSAEQLDRAVQELRCRCFGEEATAALQQERMREALAFDVAAGIDQRARKEALLQSASAVLFVCDDARMTSLMREDVRLALQAGRDAYVLAHPRPGRDVASEACLEAQLGAEDVHYLLLGEDGESVHA